jgi:hypothetical protein
MDNSFDIDWQVMDEVEFRDKPVNIPQLPKRFESMAGKLTGRDRTRELARERDNWTCQNCGRLWYPGMRRFDIHHIYECGIKSLAYDKVAALPTLITYCHRCHMLLDNHRWRTGHKVK